MKKIFYTFMTIAAAISVAGCAKELEEAAQTPGNAPEEESGYIVLGASLPDSDDPAGDTKTTISKNEDQSSYSVFWADGDAISVNGETSKPASIDPANKKNASFTLPASVNAPYCAVYPAALASDYQPATAGSGKEGEEGYVAPAPAQFTISVPKEQHYKENGVDPSAAIMYAYSTDASKALKFNHTMAYLKVNVNGTGDNDNIKSIRINGNDNEMLSGDYVLSISSDGFVFSAKPVAGSNKAPGNTSVEYLCGESGVAQNTDMFIAIPVGKYDNGLTITIVDVNNHYCVIKSLKEFTASSGIVYPTELPFKPGADDIYLEGGIYTVEDWNAFINDVNNNNWENSKYNCEWKGNDKGAHLMADIFSATNLPRTNTSVEWNGTFYGHNHTLTHNGYEHLFTHVGQDGKILDLTVAGVREKNVVSGWPSVIALNNAGEINNCESQVEFKFSGANTNAIGICRYNYSTGKIINCRNKGNITIDNPTAIVNAAGIVMRNLGTLTGCTNEGEIKVTGLDKDCVVGGIAHSVGGTEVSDLTNKASITIEAALTAHRTIYMGGIAASASATITMPDNTIDTKIATHFNKCTNEGALKITKSGAFHMKGGAIGGIVAAITSGEGSANLDDQGIKYTSFDNCANKGTISFYEKDRGNCDQVGQNGAYAIGGILGRCVKLDSRGFYTVASGYYTVIRNSCFNTGTIDVCTSNGEVVKDNTSGARQTYVGAIAGFVSGASTRAAVVRGNSANNQCIIKIGSEFGGICAGGILGGGYKVNIDGGSNANVKFTVSDNSFITPEKIGYIGAVLGWAASTVNITKTAANASFDFKDSLKASNFASGFAGVKTGVTLTVAADCTYQGNKVTEADVYGGGTKTIK